MPRQKWIDKKHATTFTLVHRSQQDPLIHDADASRMVFKEVAPSNQKVKTKSDLESEEYGGFDPSTVRSNEGEAAMYGIYYDDTEYDYMQHLRDIGESVEAVFIEAPQSQSKQKGGEKGSGGGKGKNKQSLEDAIREDSEAKNDGKTVVLPQDVLPSNERVERTYQDQQDVPDALKGFQPDMDPRLREVLEALEDEAYVEDEEGGFFSQLAASGETSTEQFEDSLFDDEYEGEEGDGYGDGEGWESDATEKATEKQKLREKIAAQSESKLPAPETVGADELAADAAEVNNEWQREFAKFKKDKTRTKKAGLLDDSSSIGGGGAGTATTATAMSLGASELCSLLNSRNNRKQKKKKIPLGSRTATSGYSMSSSALHRTEGLTTLDDRFDRIEEEYAREEEEEDDMRSQFTTASAIEDERTDFNSILDEFLGGYSTTGKKQRRVKRGKQMSGLEQLDEIRRELGPARVATR